MASLKERLKAKQEHQERKHRVIEHYSKGTMKCQCGFGDIRALSIDHINGGGRGHLKSIKGNFYSWLINNNFPDGFQVLCMNCQWIKRAENNETAANKHFTWQRHKAKPGPNFEEIKRQYNLYHPLAKSSTLCEPTDAK